MWKKKEWKVIPPYKIVVVCTYILNFLTHWPPCDPYEGISCILVYDIGCNVMYISRHFDHFYWYQKPYELWLLSTICDLWEVFNMTRARCMFTIKKNSWPKNYLVFMSFTLVYYISITLFQNNKSGLFFSN